MAIGPAAEAGASRSASTAGMAVVALVTTNTSTNCTRHSSTTTPRRTPGTLTRRDDSPGSADRRDAPAAGGQLPRLEPEHRVAGREGVRRAGHRLHREPPPAARLGHHVAGEQLQVAVRAVHPDGGAAAVWSGQPHP